MTDLAYREMATYEPRDCKAETAKSVLEEMDGILKELSAELQRINDAIYSPQNVKSTIVSNEPTAPECLLGTLNRQRSVAKTSLDLAINIREGLW